MTSSISAGSTMLNYNVESTIVLYFLPLLVDSYAYFSCHISIYSGRWNVYQFQNIDEQALWIFLSFFLFCQNSESIRNQNVHCSLLGVRRMVVILPRQKVQQFYHVIKSTYHSAPQQTNRCFLWWSYFQITIFGLIFWFTKNYRIFFNYFFI